MHARTRNLSTGKMSKSGHAFFFSFFRRVRATSVTQRRVKNSRVHFWTFSAVSVNDNIIFIFKEFFFIFHLLTPYQ